MQRLRARLDQIHISSYIYIHTHIHIYTYIHTTPRAATRRYSLSSSAISHTHRHSVPHNPPPSATNFLNSRDFAASNVMAFIADSRAYQRLSLYTYRACLYILYMYVYCRTRFCLYIHRGCLYILYMYVQCRTRGCLYIHIEVVFIYYIYIYIAALPVSLRTSPANHQKKKTYPPPRPSGPNTSAIKALFRLYELRY